MKNYTTSKFPKRPFLTKGGAKTPHRKNTAFMESVIMPPPEQVVIPMQQHIGAPCTPLVKAGDTVKVGQLIGKCSGYVGAPIHASVSGTVKKIDSIQLPGGKTQAVVIASDGQMTKSEQIKPPVVNNVEDLLTAVKESGLVGLGGAGFPAHVKLNIPKDKKVDTLIVNVAECEPYITADHREALENSWQLLSGVYTLKALLNIDKIIIAVEDNKPDVIKVLRDIADNPKYDPDDAVRILALKAKYPQGAEKVLVQACTGKKIPPNGLPADVGCLVMNITTVTFLAEYLKTGMPLVKKRVTVDGGAIKSPKNVIVPIGTPINDLIAFCGGYQSEVKKILMGGPMMGIALTDDTLPVIKQNNAILAFDEKEARLMKETNCIRCGKCVYSCPMNLVPTAFHKSVKINDTEALDKQGVMTCMECGSCAYNCPAGIYLVQNIRLGKAMLKQEQQKKKEEESK